MSKDPADSAAFFPLSCMCSLSGLPILFLSYSVISKFGPPPLFCHAGSLVWEREPTHGDVGAAWLSHLGWASDVPCGRIVPVVFCFLGLWLCFQILPPPPFFDQIGYPYFPLSLFVLCCQPYSSQVCPILIAFTRYSKSYLYYSDFFYSIFFIKSIFALQTTPIIFTLELVSTRHVVNISCLFIQKYLFILEKEKFCFSKRRVF